MIIGVTGNNGSGKDTFAQYLIDNKGFIHISLSDFIREETIKRGLAPIRANFREVGNSLRRDFGASVLSQRALARMESGRDYVVTSIRNPEEAAALKGRNNFFLVAVAAPIELRYDRIIKRNKQHEKEVVSFEEFKRLEDIELESLSTSEQQLNECIKMADLAIPNDKDLADFSHAIESAFEKIKTALGS